MKKAFLLILSAICLNSCHALVIRPLTEATVAVIGAPFYAVGKLLPKKVSKIMVNIEKVIVPIKSKNIKIELTN